MKIVVPSSASSASRPEPSSRVPVTGASSLRLAAASSMTLVTLRPGTRSTASPPSARLPGRRSRAGAVAAAVLAGSAGSGSLSRVLEPAGVLRFAMSVVRG